MKSEHLIHAWKEAVRDKKLPDVSQLKSNTTFSPEALDEKSMTLHDQISSCIDCLSCANCCKTTVTVFKEEDINRASKFLEISKKEFTKKYLIHDYGEYTTITTPCPFLLPDNKCKIYEARPQACQSFPHTGRSHFLNRLKAHQQNLRVCPITFHVIKGISKESQQD